MSSKIHVSGCTNRSVLSQWILFLLQASACIAGDIGTSSICDGSGRVMDNSAKPVSNYNVMTDTAPSDALYILDKFYIQILNITDDFVQKILNDNLH